MAARFDRPSRLSSLSLVLAALGSAAALAACDDSSGTESSGAGKAGSATSSDPTAGSAGAGTAGSATSGAAGTTPAGGSGGASTTSMGGGGSGGATDPWAGPLESLKELDLGDVKFNSQRDFPIPDRTLGLTIQIEGKKATDVVGFFRLRPPTGNVNIIYNFAMEGHDTQVFGGVQWSSASNPQTDAAAAYPVAAGNWRLTAGSDGNAGDFATARVWVRRTNDGAFHGGVLDMNIVIVPGSATQGYMDQVVSNFFPYAGLTKGKIVTYSADSSFATISSQDEYRALLAQSAGYPSAPAVNLFVVDDFSDGAFGAAIGVSGGLPGSPMRHGTAQSGLAFQPTGDPKYDASVLMHEIGHLGGLFHTTEYAITEVDPLSDTPECAAQTIMGNPDACPDTSNTMFPIAYGATSFTPAQLIVLHGSALYRGILDAGGQPAPPLDAAPQKDAPAAAFLDEPGLPLGIRAMPGAPDALERALGALWCGGGFESAALGAAGGTASLSPKTATTAAVRFRGIIFDDKLPVLLRKRALRLFLEAARKAGNEAQALETVLAIAAKNRAPASLAERRLQAAALRLVLRARPHAKAALGARMDAAIAAAKRSDDRLLAAVAAGD